MKLNKDFPHKLYLDKRVLVNGIKRNNVNYENHIELKEWIQDLIDSEELEIPSQNSRPYKVYTALLHQTGTNAPIPEIVENTLGQNIIWTRGNIGAYYGNFDTYIPNNNEVIVFVNGSRDDIVVSAFFDSGEINLLKRQLYVDFQLEEYGYNGIDNFQFVYIEIRVYD